MDRTLAILIIMKLLKDNKVERLGDNYLMIQGKGTSVFIQTDVMQVSLLDCEDLHEIELTTREYLYLMELIQC